MANSFSVTLQAARFASDRAEEAEMVAKQNSRYEDELRRVLKVRQSENPGCHIVIYFSCAGTKWSSDSRYVKWDEDKLRPSKYGWKSTWTSVTCVVYNGNFEYSHEGMKAKPQSWYSPLSWMQILNDNTIIRDIIVPGSHLSFAIEDSLSSADHPSRPDSPPYKAYICQQKTITAQLEMGVRIVDVRLGPEGRLAVDGYYLQDQYGMAFRACQSFVEKHPSQTVMVCVSWGYSEKQKTGDIAGSMKKWIGESENGLKLWYTGSSWPTLKDVRGKCVLIIGFQSANNDDDGNNNKDKNFGIDMENVLGQLWAAKQTAIQDLGAQSPQPWVGRPSAPTIAPTVIALRRTNDSEARNIRARDLDEEVERLIGDGGGRRRGLWFFNDFVSKEVVELIARMNAGN
ncbi:PLC-like phosphodiesterase [Cladorrhinum samala]|uniref:PLC-like phosphodiesterase n=1 Tax=Cladorrhinum samala TaxID=585594 RepID=A0AAV9HR68_9PEZI|nr:PLC-like phosphodiesterase [Cladorrhinum samala]